MEHEVGIAILADELAPGEERLGERPGLHGPAEIGIAYLEAQAICFLEQHLALDQGLRRLGHEVGQNHIRVVLLLQNSFRNLLHFGGGDGGGGAEVAAHEASAVHGCVVIGRGRFVGKNARHQRDDHGDYGDSNDNDEDDLDDAIVFLQKTDHGVVGAFQSELQRLCKLQV